MSEHQSDRPDLEADPLDFGGLEESDETRKPDAGQAATSKLPQSDPTLRIANPRGRQLRKSAVRGALAVFVAVAGISLLVAGTGRSTNKSSKDDGPDLFAKPVLPPALLKAAKPTAAQPFGTQRGLVEADSAEPVQLPSVPAGGEQPQRLPSFTRQLPAQEKDDTRAEERHTQQLLQEEEKARVSSALVQASAPPVPPSDAVDSDAVDLAGGAGTALDDAAGTARGPGGGGLSIEDPNLQERKNEYLSGRHAPQSGYLRASVQHPRSPFELKPGTVIPAVLETAINSDLPGPVIARVRESVCDTVQGRWLLIPQGSVLVAYYDSMVAWGQERVLVCWKQLQLPNGDSLELGCMPGADTTGQAGLNDQVDEHWWRIIKGAVLSSFISAATTAAAGDVEGYHPTVAQSFARGVASEVGDVGQAITRRNLSIQPTLTVRQGMPVNVVVTKTIDFSPDGPPTSCGSPQ